MTESGFVRVSTNPKVLPHPITIAGACHTHLLVLARRHGVGLVTFDAPLARLAPDDIVLLSP